MGIRLLQLIGIRLLQLIGIRLLQLIGIRLLQLIGIRSLHLAHAHTHRQIPPLVYVRSCKGTHTSCAMNPNPKP